MPNFHVHWLVAVKALDTAPPHLKQGYVAYRTYGQNYRGDILRILAAVRREEDVNKARESIGLARNGWSTVLLGAERGELDAMTCFSAYTLGACGPDFWMLPSDSGSSIPDFGDHHFDLGHYNRTHRQFEISAEAAGGGVSLDARAEQAYFLGMATHFAADLSLHQLVNVSAGAYNLLEKKWHNEQPHGAPLWKNTWDALVQFSTLAPWAGVIAGLRGVNWAPFLEDNVGNQLGIWSTHNKVEHYWDTYVRHRYLGDVPSVFGATDAKGWPGFEEVGLPTAEGIWRTFRAGVDGRVPTAAAATAVGKLLQEPWVKWAIEKPLTLPWLFCERVLAGQIAPFIFDRVVHDTKGAYPKELVPKAVAKEKRSEQMASSKEEAKQGRNRSEKKKLRFFSSTVNDSDSKPFSWNYLTFYACPSFERLLAPPDREQDPGFFPGANSFYDLAAVGDFGSAAAVVAGKFVRALQAAYDAHAPLQSGPPACTPGQIDGVDLGPLGSFWNLDTGLGLRVQSVATDTPRDVVTRIDLHHVFELLGERFPYFRQVPWMALFRDKKKTFGFPTDRHEFAFRDPPPPFASLGAVSEPDCDAFLKSIPLEERVASSQPRPGRVKPEEFWSPASAALQCSVETPTETVCAEAASGGGGGGARETCITAATVESRLTLEFRAAIADLGTRGEATTPAEKLSLFAVSDTSKSVGHGVGEIDAVAWAHDQYVDHDGVVIDFSEKPDQARRGLQTFSTRVLLGFATQPKDRLVDWGTWNNSIPQGRVGRNISISTGRRFVLKPDVFAVPIVGKTSGRQFDPARHYAYYDDAYPTEQLYFTIYPLARTEEGVVDLFARQVVPEDAFEGLKKIESVGVVKIILLYALDGRGALQVEECWIDGVPVPVTALPRTRA